MSTSGNVIPVDRGDKNSDWMIQAESKMKEVLVVPR